MAAKLTTEQSDALHQSGDSLPLVDPKTEKVYVLVDQSIHQQAMAALQQQREVDMAAIRRGLADADAGRTMTLEESEARTDAALARLSR